MLAEVSGFKFELQTDFAIDTSFVGSGEVDKREWRSEIEFP